MEPAGLRARYLPGPLTHPHSPPANEGDGLLMAMEVGADLANMNETGGTRRHRYRGGIRGPAARPIRRRRTDRTPLDHGRPLRAAIRQRGGQLQRHA